MKEINVGKKNGNYKYPAYYVNCSHCGKEKRRMGCLPKLKNYFCNKECKAKWQSDNSVKEKNPFVLYKDKIKDTNLKRYGVKNVMHNSKIKNKVIKTMVERGLAIPRNKRNNFKLYKQLVFNISNTNYHKYYTMINPRNLPRGRDYHLDHIFSIKDGFTHNIAPWALAHPTNLRVIDGRLNESKNSKSDVSYLQFIMNIKVFGV